RSFIQGNRAGSGGGIYNSGTSNIINSVISGNSADRSSVDGGGVAGSNYNLINSTVAGNYAARYGGGISAGSGVTIANSVLWGNTAGTSSPQINGTPTVSYSDVGQTGYPSGTNINADPRFVNLQQATSGYPTTAGNYHLCYASGVPDAACTALSPCIDSASASNAPSDDIDRQPRPLGSGYEMGADEFAVIFTVTKTTDTRDGTCDADCSLREAVDAANASTAPPVISIPAGTYAITRAGSDNTNENGDFDVTKSVAFVGAGAGSTIIDGGDLDRIIHVIYGSGATIKIKDLTLTNGDAGTGDGGCMDTQNNNLTVTSVQFSGCSTSGNGGALNTNGATLTVTGSTFDNNQAGASGGAVYSTGAASSFTNTTISNNSAFTAGGGIYSNNYVTLTSSTVSGNRTTDTVTNGNGGGVIAATGLDITDTTISGNTSTKNGGGAFLNGSATMTVLRSTFSGNTAKNSGGGLLTWNGTINVYNSTISGNSAANGDTGAGGGIYTKYCTIKSSTIYGNTSSYGGGGVHNVNGTCTIQNTIFKLNVTTCRNIADIISSGKNIDDKAEGVCFYAANGDFVNTDALLNDLADNGGLTKTHALQTSPSLSPAIDAGDNTACAASPINNKDQRGKTRPADGNGDLTATCDIGAYEYIP
ncbi:MAG: CSLREA domain-containing protein, partial [Nitrospirota bacterium]|nr:CSLREA domain-containing protein [Nitrospirota bacterium]